MRICVLDESTYHGSSMVIQTVAMTIEDSIRIAQEKGQAKPDTVIIVGDNTVKELKNSNCLNYLLSLVAHKRVRCLYHTSEVQVFVLLPFIIALQNFKKLRRCSWSSGTPVR